MPLKCTRLYRIFIAQRKINNKEPTWQFLTMSNVAGRLIAGLGMNMQRWRWFRIAGIKKQWMKSLAGCTVTPVRPGTREDDYNTSLIGQSSWSRTSCSVSKTALKPGFLWKWLELLTMCFTPVSAPVVAMVFSAPLPPLSIISFSPHAPLTVSQAEGSMHCS